MVWRKIGGRGNIGDTNWGVDFDSKNTREDVEPLLKEVKKHIGEKILLTGGGGFGSHVGVLKGATIGKMFKDGYRVKVNLEKLDPPLASDTTFTPWLDSWQISVWVK